MEETLNLEDILKVIRKNIFTILALMLLGGSIAAFTTQFLMTPQYQANSQVLVTQSQESDGVNNQDIQASLQLVNTYRDIILSPTVLDEVVANLNLDMTSAQLASKINVDNQNQSQVISIIVSDENYNTAARISNEVSEVFQEKVQDVMNIDNVSILAPAIEDIDASPVSPNPLVNILIGIILGMLVGLAIAFLKEFFDKRVQSEEEMRSLLDVPVLGTVNKM